MKVSLNTIKQYIDFELPPVDELVSRINAQLGGVEEIIDLGAKYKDAKIVRVVECEKHANADKLSVCMIDAGTGELVQVVCGANNVHTDMWAVWLPPESTVPATYDDQEPFVLGARELRGVMSNGMLASARELAIGDDHDGIVDITEADVPQGKVLNPGDSFADVFGLDDTIIDIENKMFTHRPDLFGQLGVAREIAGIFGKQFSSPEWYLNPPELSSGSGNLVIDVFNDAPEQSPRFMAVAIQGVEIKPSPLWLQCALVAMGGKPINNIVDATNYVMLTTAQPTHAYDYAKIRGQRLGVRMANDGEKLPLLNGKTYELSTDDIVIADAEGAIGLAGIMGGGNSEVSASTTDIVLEVANFDMYAVRKTSMRHGLFTDALTRFNKGQSSLQNDRVLMLLMSLIRDIAGGVQASDIQDKRSALLEPAGVAVTPEFINERLGLSLSGEEVAELLENVECAVDEGLIVSLPFWRTDLELPEDIVEEVGRLYGYDRLPRELPLRSTKPVPVNAERELAESVRRSLARAGANEVLTYSFVHERVLKAAGQDVSGAYRLANALSPDLQYYRRSLTPSLLDKVHANIKAGYDEFALFEMGKSHSIEQGLDDEGLPLEPGKIALVYASKKAKDGAAFYRAKKLLEFITGRLGIELTTEPLGDMSTSQVVTPFETKRSAIVVDKKTGQGFGVVGEYKKAVQRNFKLPEYTAGFEIDIRALLQLVESAPVSYRPLSRFPSIERDISLRVKSTTTYADVLAALEDALAQNSLDTSIVPVGLFQPQEADTKNLSFRITLTSHDKTLTSQEANDVIATAMVLLKTKIDAEVV